MEFNWPIRVYIEDTDAGGIVFYVNYLKFMERARTEFLRHIGFDHAAMINQGGMFVVHSTNIRYLVPASLDNELIVTVGIGELRRTHLTFNQSIVRKKDNQLLSRADVKVACVTRESMRPQVIPNKMKDALMKFFKTGGN